MPSFRSIAGAVLPRQLKDAARSAHRQIVFRRAMKKFLADPRRCSSTGHPVLRDLIYGWGNESFSALDEYLVGCLDEAFRTNGPILECGSGLSTLLVGAVAKSRGLKHIALEHHPAWADRVNLYLDRYGLSSVVISNSPIKDWGEFAWYDAVPSEMPAEFGMVICDGPPGSTKGGRYGLTAVMRERLGKDCVILLDDAGREHELEVAKRWQRELSASREDLGGEKPFIRLVVGAGPELEAA
jgi:hypothetical protein